MVRRAIAAAETEEMAVEAASFLPEVLARMVSTGREGETVGRAGGELIDRLTRRLIDLALERMGPPPSEFAWIALGSIGRCERTLLGDQDSALVYCREVEDPFFASLAESVTSGLARAGLPLCPSGVIATHPAFRRPEREWLGQLRDWIHADQEAAFFAEIVLDYRLVSGGLRRVEAAMNRLALRAGGLPFLRRLAGLTVSRAAPLHGFGHIAFAPDQRGRMALDLKAMAINPLTELARFFALSSRVAVPGTYQRLRLVGAGRGEWAETARNLLPAFSGLQNLRLRHQAQHFLRSGRLDNCIYEEELTETELALLRRGLRTLRRVQSGVQNWLDWTL